MKRGKLNIIKTCGFVFCTFFISFCSPEKQEEEKKEYRKSKPNEISVSSDEMQVSEETVMIGDFDFAEKS